LIIDATIAPYLRGRFTVDRSIYLNQLAQANIYTTDNYTFGGHSAGVELSSVLKPAVGEFIERHSLFFNKRKTDDYVPAFRLIDGETIDVSAQEIVFVRGGKFNDSCGVASHLNSRQAIEHAFLEFFERQSFIFNWLTCSEGLIIPETLITDEKNKVFYKILHSFVDDVYLFEISLHKDIRVVLGLGIGEFHKTIGLSAHFDLQEAINSTFEEMLQSVSKYYNKQEVTAYEEEELLDSMDIYQKAYMNLTAKE